MKIKYPNIEAERARRGLSKTELAEKLSVTTKTYLNYTRGAAIPSSKLITMSQVFDCSVDYLLGISTTT